MTKADIINEVAIATGMAKKEVAKAEPKKAETKFSIKKKDDAAATWT